MNKLQFPRRVVDIDDQLVAKWDVITCESRLAWNEARDAVRDGLHYFDRKLPGDFGNDGR